MSVRHALLALLSEGPKYGLQLRQEFEARTGEVWPLNVGQVYTTLQRLERDGLVVSEGDDEGPQRPAELCCPLNGSVSSSLGRSTVVSIRRAIKRSYGCTRRRALPVAAFLTELEHGLA